MSADERPPPSLTRRDALRLCLVPVSVATAGWLVGCASDTDGATDSRDETGTDHSTEDSEPGAADKPSGKDAGKATTATQDAGKPPRQAAADAGASGSREPSVDAGSQAVDPPDARVQVADASVSSDAATADVPWASGGTKSMQGNYPDPFASGAGGAMCALYPALTLGPCYSKGPAARPDISDGMTGLPVRLSFLVVRADGCTPVPSAEVDLWHTGSNGVYSAFASGICNPDKLDVVSMRFCRGTQTTDAKGRVDFSTIFPGWYTGRSIHIHFTVRVGGKEYITSQLFFDDMLTEEILLQPDYKARGKRDTTNKTDNILSGKKVADYVFSTAKRQDGAMHAWKVLSLKS